LYYCSRRHLSHFPTRRSSDLIAKNLVAAGVADELLVQISYAIGVKDPIGIYVNTYGTAKTGLPDSEIAQKIHELFDMTPYGIERSEEHTSELQSRENLVCRLL